MLVLIDTLIKLFTLLTFNTLIDLLIVYWQFI